jgi:hypothetical protein
MQWHNKFNLPQPLAEAIIEDLYFGKRQAGLLKYCSDKGLVPGQIVHFSVGELIKPPRMVVLSRRYQDSLIKDVAADVYRILGTAVHALMFAAAQRSADPYYTAEERLFYHFTVAGQVVVVSGEPDLVHGTTIDDYKVTAVWSWIKGVKDEWEKQLNLYAMFRTLAGRLTEQLRIIFILRDWNLNETMQEGYPPAGAQVAEAKLWTFSEQEAYLKERIKLHLDHREDNDDELPECTPDEMWEKEEAWAVVREGGKRAWRVCVPSKATPFQAVTDDGMVDAETKAEAALREAQAIADACNLKPDVVKGKKKPMAIEHRPGERTRCLRFCDVASKCNQFKEYQAAAFREPSREPAEEIA